MQNNFERPLLILGLPRSGTSLVAGILSEFGLWLGDTVPGGDASNPKGFFENVDLRDRINKPLLQACDSDPSGVRQLPSLDTLPPAPWLKDRVQDSLTRQGYASQGPWGFKDAKLTLLWPLWRAAFPRARWLIVQRPRELVIKSCLKTHFMHQHSDDWDYWERFCDAYEARLSRLEVDISEVRRIDSNQIVHGDLAELERLIDDLGLEWDANVIEAFIDPNYWGENNSGTVGLAQ